MCYISDNFMYFLKISQKKSIYDMRELYLSSKLVETVFINWYDIEELFN